MQRSAKKTQGGIDIVLWELCGIGRGISGKYRGEKERMIGSLLHPLLQKPTGERP